MSRVARDPQIQARAPVPSKEAKRRVGRAAATWAVLALGSIVTMTALIVWHLIRRGRLIREGLQPPRKVDLTEVQPSEPAPASAPKGG
jgi:hypothetical protein